MFADDTTLYVTGSNVKSLYSTMNNDLDNLADWFKANKLALNVKKTKYILFQGCRKLTPQCRLSIDNVIIEKVDSLKFLGIYVDNELRWNIHTHFIEKKVAGGLYALNSTKHMLPTALLRSLYFALINSYLQYGCLLWGNTYEKYLHKIKVSQKKAMRVICHATYNTPASPLFKMLNIINFEDLFK